MKLYYVSGDCEGPYHATLDAAKRQARDAAAESCFDVPVHRVEVETTQDSILRMLNNTGGYHYDRGVVYTAKARKQK